MRKLFPVFLSFMLVGTPVLSNENYASPYGSDEVPESFYSSSQPDPPKPKLSKGRIGLIPLLLGSLACGTLLAVVIHFSLEGVQNANRTQFNKIPINTIKTETEFRETLARHFRYPVHNSYYNYELEWSESVLIRNAYMLHQVFPPSSPDRFERLLKKHEAIVVFSEHTWTEGTGDNTRERSEPTVSIDLESLSVEDKEELFQEALVSLWRTVPLKKKKLGWTSPTTLSALGKNCDYNRLLWLSTLREAKAQQEQESPSDLAVPMPIK